MTRLTIDNRRVEVPEGTTVLRAAEELGIVIPRFCYHKHLSIAGNCRMCLVEVEGVKNPVISCKEPVREGMIVRTDSEMVRRARADVLEFILLNHPIDCPVCDQAGECDLQDYYFKYSLRPRRSIEPMVHKQKAVRIGPHVMLDAERCVDCARCVRFCEEVAGVHEIGFFERSDRTAIGVLEGKELANPYSLCTVDLCPVGALTSADFRFKKRVWFLKSAPSICLGCATGCSVWVDHADSIVYRLRSREGEASRGGWLCDFGRMTYKAMLAENRILAPLVRGDGKLRETSWDEALSFAAGLVSSNDAKEVVGVLSARSSLEENTALMELCGSFKASRLVWSGEDPDPSFGDRILRDADRNPNTAGVKRIAAERIGDLKSGLGLIVLDGLGSNDLMRLVESRPAWVILISAKKPQGAGWADCVLPKTVWLESGGTYVNRDGREQYAPPLFEPVGGAKTVEDIAKAIARGRA